MNKLNDTTALAALVGTDFYTTYLNNGNIITMYQYEQDFMMFDNDGGFIHTNMEQGGKYQRSAERQGFSTDVELFKNKGLAITFQA